MSEKSPFLVAVGKAIQKARKERGLSQERLAELADVHRTYIGMLERGEKNMTLTNAKKVCEALQIPLSTLFNNL